MIVASVFFSCKSKKTQNDEQQSNSVKQEKLIIEGNQIWVRSEPTDGEVVMKLNNGTECLIIEKGKSEIINGISDFWYKISYENEEGWVFGSQTNLKQNNEKTTTSNEEIVTFLNNFFDDLSNKKQSLKNYFINDSLYTLYNPGAIVYINSEKYSVLFDIIGKYNMKSNKINFGILPEFDMEKFEWSQKGNFVAEQINCTDISGIATFYNENIEESFYNIDKIVKDEKNITYKLLITEISHGVYFYFGKVNNQWKIIAVDYSTFDA